MTLDNRDFNAASSRAYYAMFYAASALLAARDVHRQRHRGVVSALGKEFVKNGSLDPEFGRIMNEAFETRLACDYKVGFRQSEGDARALVEQARAFLAACEERLKVELDALGEEPGASNRKEL